ncbi:MAG: ABC transporter permease [Clostridium sp.]
MIIFKSVIKQCKSHSVIIVVFILAFYISTLIISATTSLIKGFVDIDNEYNEVIGENTELVSVNYVDSYNHKNMIKSLGNIDNNTKVRMDIEVTDINSDKERVVAVGEFFIGGQECKYPLLEGRYYTAEEVVNSDKVVLIGKNHEKYILKSNNRREIYIDGELYEVIGIVGKEGKKSVWDDNIFMPITSFTKISVESVESLFFSKMYVINNEFSESEAEKIIKNLKDLDSRIGAAKEKVNFNNENNIKRAISVNFQYIFIAIMIIIFATVNLGVISYFWISDRIYEIGVKKAFGITNKQIVMSLYTEIVIIIAFSSILSIITHYIVSKFDIINLELSIINTFVILLINIVISVIISSAQCIRAIKVEPIQIIKR